MFTSGPRHLRFALVLTLGIGACWMHSSTAEELRPPSAQEYWAQVDKHNWDDAILAAERLIEAARLEANDKPLELAEALSLLGDAQLVSRNFVAAEAAYSEALQILGPRVPPTSERLIEPLRGMGFTLAHTGKHDQAVPFLERALLVMRRTHGLFDINQRNLLRQFATSLAMIGEFVEAERQMRYFVRVGQQNYGAQDPRMSGVYDQLGDFYMQMGVVGSARDAYRSALSVVERKLGRDHLDTIMPLRSYAASYRRELVLVMYGMRTAKSRESAEYAPANNRSANPRYLNASGERALKRALKTLERNPDRPTSLLFDTLLDMGDWYMVKGATDDALTHYRRAAALLDDVEPERIAAARAKLSFPAQVYYPIPSAATRYLNRPPDEVEEHFVQIGFTVAPDGRIHDERVVEASAPQRFIDATLNAVRDARYRPKFVAGAPVETHDVSVRQVYRSKRGDD